MAPADGTTPTALWSPAYWENELYMDKGTGFYYEGSNWKVGNWSAFPALSPSLEAFSDFNCQYLASVYDDYFEAKCLNGSIVIYSGLEYWTNLDFYKNQSQHIPVDPLIHHTVGGFLSSPATKAAKILK